MSGSTKGSVSNSIGDATSRSPDGSMVGRDGCLRTRADWRRRVGYAAAVVLVMAVWASVEPAFASCSCQCVEGVARTACSSVDEARRNPDECGGGGPKVACAMPPALEASPQRYAAPKGGTDCRDRRLWDPETNAYSVVAKVCGLAPAEAGG